MGGAWRLHPFSECGMIDGGHWIHHHSRFNEGSPAGGQQIDLIVGEDRPDGGGIPSAVHLLEKLHSVWTERGVRYERKRYAVPSTAV